MDDIWAERIRARDTDWLSALLDNGLDAMHAEARADALAGLVSVAITSDAPTLLLNAGADPNRLPCDVSPRLPLVIAARMGGSAALGTVSLLLDAGADLSVTARGKDNIPRAAFEAFHLALANDNVPLITRFHQKGLPDFGHGPEAVLTGVLGEARSVAMLHHLLHLGAEANPPNDGRIPPLYTAVTQRMSKPSLPVIRALLEAGADPDATWTTLHGPTSARLEAKREVLMLIEEFDRKRLEAATPEGAGVRPPIRL